MPNKAIKIQPRAAWNSIGLLVLRFFTTQAQNNQYNSGLLWRRYISIQQLEGANHAITRVR